MPRRNNTPKIVRTQLPKPEPVSKVRHATKQAALNAANSAMRYNLDLTLSVYQSPADKGWYLTSTK
ncbi:MAG: hypothetical protein WAQ25_02415 [Candidatus Saccharimonas sp.]